MASQVITLRLKDKELGFIKKISMKSNSDRSYAARILIDNGWMYYILKEYKEGKISTGRAAEELEISISELIDLLADLGIKSPINYEDYLEGEKYAKELFR